MPFPVYGTLADGARKSEVGGDAKIAIDALEYEDQADEEPAWRA